MVKHIFLLLVLLKVKVYVTNMQTTQIPIAVLEGDGVRMQDMGCFMTVKNLMVASFLKPSMADALHAEEQPLAVAAMVQEFVVFVKEEVAS